jgi:hypothetical protein
MQFFKLAFIGNISEKYVNPQNTGIVASLAQLDHSDNLLKNGELGEAMKLLKNICEKDPKIKKRLSPWLHSA